MNKKTIIIFLIIAAVLLFATGFIKGKGGNTETETEEEKRQSDKKDKVAIMKSLLLESKVFGIDMYKKVELNKYYVNNYSEIIKDLKSELTAWFNTDESKVLNIFENLENTYQISFIANAYKIKYERSFRNDLIDENLSDENLIQLYNIINAY